MRRAVQSMGLMLLACGLAYTQTEDKSLTFDAASVKPAAPPVPDGRGRIMIAGPSGGPGTKDPGRIRYPFMNLRSLITIAYDVKAFQVTGPAWLDSERFEITATMPPTTTKEQFHIMLQNLLAERFKMTLHRESKELPTYTLSVNKGGPKLKESAPAEPPKETDGDTPPPLPNGPPKMGPDGFPILPSPLAGRGGIFMMMMPGRARLMGTQATMNDLADRLTQQLSKPVTNATGLTGKYDFALTFSPEGLPQPMGPMGMPGPSGGAMVAIAGGPAGDGGRGPGGDGKGPGGQSDAETPPDIFHAVQAQLGLRLDSKKGAVETLVIDHVEKTPTDN